MSRCLGQIPVTTKVDQPMREFVETEAGRLGVSRAEFVRRLLELYRESRAGNTPCDSCGEPVEIELNEI